MTTPTLNWFHWTIDNYIITFHISSDARAICIINLYQTGKRVADIMFFANGTGTHDYNVYGTNTLNPWASLTLHMEELPNIIDLLRNEKPIYLHVPWGKPSGFRPTLTTSQEPVGENETSNP